MRVTVEKLKALDACVQQVHLFAELFPNGVDVTEVLCVAHADKFDWDWAARHLLPAPFRADYEAKRAALLTDYQAKRAALLTDYQAKRAALLTDYQAKRAPLWADYLAKRAPLWADYEAKRAALWADYEAKRAALFGRLAEQVK